ncbi:MAG: glycosyltransferase family 2 protein [Gammaproteobacteria bacterium]
MALKDTVWKTMRHGSKPWIELSRSINDLGYGARTAFLRKRQTKEYQSLFNKEYPLVTVCIATYNRAELLIERSLSSILKQDYENLQIIVVGDHCTDETEHLMQSVSDPRIEFVNLPQRGCYPDEPRHRWMVAGTQALNHALTMARGDFVTHLDDDDEHPADRVSKLVHFIQQQRADLVWHPFNYERIPEEWHVNTSLEFRARHVSTSSVFYHRWFAGIPWDINAWKYDEPGDWNRFRKFRFLGAKTVRHPEILLSHYRERNQKQK